jgi:branched-chain amino acid transport system substrate-binding protein
VALVTADARVAGNPLIGGRANAERYFTIVHDRIYPLKTENFTPILDAVAATSCDPVVLLLSVGHDPDGHVHTQRIALPRKGLEVFPVVTFPLPAV